MRQVKLECMCECMYVCGCSCLRLVLSLGSMQELVHVESCDSHLHHSLQMVTPHQMVTSEGLVGGKE